MSKRHKSKPQALVRTTTMRCINLDGSCIPANPRLKSPPVSPSPSPSPSGLGLIFSDSLWDLNPDPHSVFEPLRKMDPDDPDYYRTPPVHFDNLWHALPARYNSPTLLVSMEDTQVEIWDYDHSRFTGSTRDEYVFLFLFLSFPDSVVGSSF